MSARTRITMTALVAALIALPLLGAELARAAPPQEEVLSLRDALLAGGVRVLLVATIESIDLEQLKGNAIEKVRAKDENAYRKQMDRVFDDLESVDIDEVLGLTRTSSREDVIAALQRADKASLLRAIEAIPDASIAHLLDRKLKEKGATSFPQAHDYIQNELGELVEGLSE